MKRIFAKNCIIKIYFAYIFIITVRYFRQNVFNIYSNTAEIYFRDALRKTFGNVNESRLD